MSAIPEGVATGTGDISVRPMATTFVYYAAFIGLGLVSASLGPTLPTLAAQTGTALREISFLFTTRASGYMLGSLLGGRLYDRVAGHPFMAICLLIMALGMVIAPLFSLLWGLALVLLVIGIAEGAIDVGCNTLLVWVHRAKVGPFMNALHFFFGLGAFLTPIIIAQAMIATGGIRWGYWLLALYLMPIAILLLRLASPRHEAAHVSGERRLIPVNWRITGLVMFFMFIYAGAEIAMGGWLYSYAVALELADTTGAAYLTSAYWGALTLGRLLSIPIATRFRPRSILWTDLIGSLMSVGLIILLPGNRWALWVGAFGLGLFLASVFPTVITWSERRMTLSGLATSMFLVGASVGAMFFPWLIGQLFDRLGPSVTMIVIFVDLLVCCLVFMLLMAFGGSPQTEVEASA